MQARAGVIYARELGVTRLGVAADETLYGQGLAQLVLSAARDLGFDAIDGGGGTLAEQARRVRAAGADGVYFAACGTPGDMLDLVAGVPDAKVFTGDCYLGQWRSLPQLTGGSS